MGIFRASFSFFFQYGLIIDKKSRITNKTPTCAYSLLEKNDPLELTWTVRDSLEGHDPLTNQLSINNINFQLKSANAHNSQELFSPMFEYI
jgi:hypothetical protein